MALLKKKEIILTVTAKVSIGKNKDGGFQLAVEMDVDILGMDQKEAEELVKKAHLVCPYSNATRNNIEVKLAVTTTAQIIMSKENSYGF